MSKVLIIQSRIFIMIMQWFKSYLTKKKRSNEWNSSNDLLSEAMWKKHAVKIKTISIRIWIDPKKNGTHRPINDLIIWKYTHSKLTKRNVSEQIMAVNTHICLPFFFRPHLWLYCHRLVILSLKSICVFVLCWCSNADKLYISWFRYECGVNGNIMNGNCYQFFIK